MPERLQPSDAFGEAERIIRESIWETGPWQADAQLEADGNWYPYVAGYKDAADKVIDTTENEYFDNLVYPVMFLYRHYMEIMIKQMLWEFRSFQHDLKRYHGDMDYSAEYSEKKDPIVMHDLMDIWKELRKLIEKYWSDEEDLSFLADVERRVREFHAIDQSSFAFRYPVDKENTPVFQFDQEIRKVNVLQVKKVIDAITTRFGGALDKLDHRRETLRELISEYESEVRWESDAGPC